MKLTFTLQKEDYLTHQLFQASQSKTIRNKRLRNWLIVSITYIALAMFTFYTGKTTLPAGLAAFAVIWLAAYPFYSRWFYKRHYSKYLDEHYKNRFGKTGKMSIEKDEIVISDTTGTARLKLSEIEKITEISSHFFAAMKTGGSLILPKDSTNRQTLNSFIKKLEAKNTIQRIEIPDWKWR